MPNQTETTERGFTVAERTAFMMGVTVSVAGLSFLLALRSITVLITFGVNDPYSSIPAPVQVVVFVGTVALAAFFLRVLGQLRSGDALEVSR
jgi:hypothetical protein